MTSIVIPRMKSFLCHLLIFFLPVAILATGAEVLLRRIPNEYAYKRAYLDQHAGELDWLVLGNSHAYFGVNPRYMPVPAFNASAVSQSLDYDRLIYTHYAPRLKRLKWVLVPIGYVSLYSRTDVTIEVWRRKFYDIYYGIHTSFAPRYNFELCSTKLRVNLEKLKNFYLLKDPMVVWDQWGCGTTYKASHRENLEASGEFSAKLHTMPDDRYLPGNLEEVRAMIALAKAQGTQVLLYTPPAYSSYYSRLDPKQLSGTIEHARAFQSENSNVHYVNFMQRHPLQAGDFYDADHLNDVGAEKFTHIINETIQKIEAGQPLNWGE